MMNSRDSFDWTIGGMILLMISCWHAPAHSQITVGYRSPIGLSVNRTISDTKAQKNGPGLFEVAGVNVIPVDGSLIYTQDTIFKILDQTKPFSLVVLDTNQIQTSENKVRGEFVSAGSTGTVFASVSGPAAGAVPQPFGGLTQRSDFLEPTPPNTSVFGQ